HLASQIKRSSTLELWPSDTPDESVSTYLPLETEVFSTDQIVPVQKPSTLIPKLDRESDVSINTVPKNSVIDSENAGLTDRKTIKNDKDDPNYEEEYSDAKSSPLKNKESWKLTIASERNVTSTVSHEVNDKDGSTRTEAEKNTVTVTRESDDDNETTVLPTVVPVSNRVQAPAPPDSHHGLDAASITGISLGILVFAALIGAVSFVLYRRRFLNKPQTLNDKCSNPDSSGYIDDSTLRENSEEMYSLDNDSFLNSLEAMTIQNYWTDNVKHTKL
ncbi:hypothetical protein L9F63_012554, partial [Diploptera punctata]